MAWKGRGYIYNAYIQYDGLKPFGFRIGAYTPSEGIEDQTGSADLFFLERAASVDIARNIAGAPSREARRASSRKATVSRLAFLHRQENQRWHLHRCLRRHL